MDKNRFLFCDPVSNMMIRGEISHSLWFFHLFLVAHSRYYSEILQAWIPCRIRKCFLLSALQDRHSIGHSVLGLLLHGSCQWWAISFLVPLLVQTAAILLSINYFLVFNIYQNHVCTKNCKQKLNVLVYFISLLFQEHLPELYVHFQSQSFHTSMYASSWFLTIFLTTFPLPIATRIFDIFMSEVTTK